MAASMVHENAGRRENSHIAAHDIGKHVHTDKPPDDAWAESLAYLHLDNAHATGESCATTASHLPAAHATREQQRACKLRALIHTHCPAFALSVYAQDCRW